jgi:hypothetical protein
MPDAKRERGGQQFPVSKVASKHESPSAFLESSSKMLFAFNHKIPFKIRLTQTENVGDFKHHLAEVHIDFSQQLPWQQVRALAAAALLDILQSHRLSFEGDQIGQETKDLSDALSQTKGDEGHRSQNRRCQQVSEVIYDVHKYKGTPPLKTAGYRMSSPE